MFILLVKGLCHCYHSSLLIFNTSVIGDKIYLYGGIDEDGAKTCAEGLYLLTPGTANCVTLNGCTLPADSRCS